MSVASVSLPPASDELRVPSDSGPKKNVFMALASVVALCVLLATTSRSPDSTAQPTPTSRFRKLQESSTNTEPTQPFSFDAPFGSNMVLQYGKHSRAAIYGFLGPKCKGVELHLYESKPNDPYHRSVFVSQQASINATHQPYNQNDTDTTWGPRPCTDEGCPNVRGADRRPFNPWNQPLPTWKVLLPPQETPGGNYSVVAMCQDAIGAAGDPTITLYNLTFGDVWYCSGQSNMGLPLKHTFHRSQLTKDIAFHGKYHNIHIMAGNSDANRVYYSSDHPTSIANYGDTGGTNPWMSSLQALHAESPDRGYRNRLEMFSGTCWYFAQHLTDRGAVDYPIGLINTAIGGRRIQEFMDNRTISQCHQRTVPGQGDTEPYLWWESQLYASQVLPFVDMTLKGFLWYQGENNMYEVKGNSKASIGYGCEIKHLIEGWRRVWSETPNTTHPAAPFGIVTLAKDTSEAGPDFGTMRHAQTANYGVLPPPQYPVYDVDSLLPEEDQEEEIGLANTFVAQAYDLGDEWNADNGPCLIQNCCDDFKTGDAECTNQTLYDICNSAQGACTVTKETNIFMGTIHPRSKSEVGQRLAIAAHNLFYGGKEAYTGPTLQGCSVNRNERVLEIQFNATLMRGDTLAEIKYPPVVTLPRWSHQIRNTQVKAGGSQLFIQTNAEAFCMEEWVLVKGELHDDDARFTCPTWAGGIKKHGRHAKNDKVGPYSTGWVEVPYTLKDDYTIVADLSGIPEKQQPTAVMYAWGNVDCCDHTDPDLFVTKSCIANCPLKSKKGQLPANPFKAKIFGGKCECIAPQICSGNDGSNVAGVN